MKIKFGFKEAACIVILLVAFYGAVFYLPAQRAKALSGKATVGTIVDSGVKNRIYYTYMVGDSLYHGIGHARNSKYMVGRKYKVYYDPEEPENSEIMVDQRLRDEE
jgi:hypothetical protein